jgi:CheY-like chemotaxis protein
VLVVDDEPLIRWSIGQTLETDGYEVIEAADSAEAIRQLFARAPFDALFLDLQLPDSDDLRLLGLLRRLAPDLPIVLMTAFATPETERQARALGAARVLRKPFDLGSLVDLMDILRGDERSDDSGR